MSFINCTYLYYKELLSYRLNILMFMLYGILPLITATIVRSDEYLVQYYILVFVISQLVNGWTANELSSDISTGKIANNLILPRSLRYSYVCNRVAMLLFTMPVLVLFLLGLAFFGINVDVSNLHYGLVSISMAIFIQLNIAFILGFIAAWTDKSIGIISLWFSVLLPLSGIMFPLEVLGVDYLEMLLYTPFPHYVYTPVSILLDASNNSLLIKQFVMAIITFLISKAVEHKFYQRNSSYGC